MTWRPSFQKELQILIRLTTEQFSTLPQSILNEPWPRENACASGSCLDMASFLTYRVLAGNGEWHGGLCSPTMFSGSIPEPMLWFSITVAFLYVMQCRLRARRSRASSMVFRPWPLRTEIVPDSLNLWMILCTVDDDNFKLFAIFLWETPFWYCSTIFRRSIGELVILFPSWLLRDTATLRGSFYTQSCCQLT